MSSFSAYARREEAGRSRPTSRTPLPAIAMATEGWRGGRRDHDRISTHSLVTLNAPAKATAWSRSSDAGSAARHHCCIVARGGVSIQLPLSGGAELKQNSVAALRSSCDGQLRCWFSLRRSPHHQVREICLASGGPLTYSFCVVSCLFEVSED